MNYKIIMLAPSCGGKSSLMRYLREHTNLNVIETDEEIVKLNNGVWPRTDNYHSLVSQSLKGVIDRNNIVYLAKDLSSELVKQARDRGFKIYILSLTLKQLIERNDKRIKEEGYDDHSMWFTGQIKQMDVLSHENLIDGYIDGNFTTEQIAEEVVKLTKRF